MSRMNDFFLFKFWIFQALVQSLTNKRRLLSASACFFKKGLQRVKNHDLQKVFPICQVADRVKFGLPDFDGSQPRGPYRGLDELESAPEEVKKIFSLEMATRRQKTDEWKRILIDQVRLGWF